MAEAQRQRVEDRGVDRAKEALGTLLRMMSPGGGLLTNQAIKIQRSLPLTRPICHDLLDIATLCYPYTTSGEWISATITNNHGCPLVLDTASMVVLSLIRRPLLLSC